MSHPAPGWTGPKYTPAANVVSPDGGPQGLGDLANNWDKATFEAWLAEQWAATFGKTGIAMGGLRELVHAIISVFQGDVEPLEELIEEAVRGIPLVGDLFADFWDAIRGEYEGDVGPLLAIQALFAPIRRVVQIFTGRPGGLGADAAEVDNFWGDMQATLKGEPTSGSWFEDVSIAAASGVEQLAENIAGGVAAGAGAIANAGQKIADLLGIADSAQKIAMAAQQQIQDLQNETGNPDFNGFAWSTIFSGADGAPLSSTDWAGSSEIVIRGDSGYAGVAEGSADGYYYKVSQYEFETDSQSASVVLGSRTSDDLWSSVCVRCDPAMTQGAFCRFNRSTIQLGRFTRSGSSWTWTVWTSVPRTGNQGDIPRPRCSGDNYYVLVNGVTVLAWTDSGATVSKGAGFRRAAFVEQKGSNVFGFAIASWRIASFAMADWLPPGGTVTTPSWQLRRGTGTAVALAVAHGSQALLPTNFYTINDRSTDVDIDLANGAATIQTSGWYEIAATSMNRDDNGDEGFSGTPNGNTVNAWRSSPWVLYVDGAAMIGPVMSGVAVKVYLAAGQVVRTGVAASSPNYPTTRSGDGEVANLTATSNISHVSGGPSASFTGRKLTD
ncbi:minor tail protein [Gordonia phage Dmitri]|nr:minor tail protein [Gordonia phage Dmitri]